jgi:hypothetical protein
MAWNTGHEGGAATLHANNAKAGLDRLAMLISMHPDSPKPIEPLIGEAVHVVVHIARTPEGRCVQEIIEVSGYEDGATSLALCKGARPMQAPVMPFQLKNSTIVLSRTAPAAGVLPADPATSLRSGGHRRVAAL